MASPTPHFRPRRIVLLVLVRPRPRIQRQSCLLCRSLRTENQSRFAPILPRHRHIHAALVLLLPDRGNSCQTHRSAQSRANQDRPATRRSKPFPPIKRKFPHPTLLVNRLILYDNTLPRLFHQWTCPS